MMADIETRRERMYEYKAELYEVKGIVQEATSILDAVHWREVETRMLNKSIKEQSMSQDARTNFIIGAVKELRIADDKLKEILSNMESDVEKDNDRPRTETD